jgi:lipoate-protein ligase A
MIRRLDLGPLGAVASQAVYHGLARAVDAGTPDTVVFCSPAEAYFCVGYHQNPGEVLDLDLCRRHGRPVLRRQIGGGAVYLDQAQLFYQVIVHRARAPHAVERIYRTYLAAPVLALQRLGLEARLRRVNEIEVGGRRIAGTGGGQLGEAVVTVGNLLLDFPAPIMARAWRVPSATFRRFATEGLERYLTSLRHELGSVPAMEELTDLLARCYGGTLGRPLVPGRLTPREEEAIREAGVALAADAASADRREVPARGLKIAADTHVRECIRQTPGGPVRVTVRVRGERIDAVDASAPAWRGLARAVEGQPYDRTRLLAEIGRQPGGPELIAALADLVGAGGTG